MTEKGALHDTEPIEVFWLKIEPSYIKTRRDKGYQNDRTELNFLEKKMAYGISYERGSNDGEWTITFIALPKRPVTLKLDGDGRPRCYGNANGKASILTEMFVQTKENWVGLPTVNYVNLVGLDLDTGEKVEEKVTP